MRVQL